MALCTQLDNLGAALPAGDDLAQRALLREQRGVLWFPYAAHALYVCNHAKQYHFPMRSVAQGAGRAGREGSR